MLMMMMMVWLCSSSRIGVVRGEGRFSSVFIFGDSIVDVGNNNYMLTLTRANQRPFGIDYPQGPTGRFTNGKTVLDVFGSTSALYSQIDGVNLDTELEWFGKTVEEMQQTLSVKGAQQRLAQSLYFVVIGSNDYIKDYLGKRTKADQQLTEAQFRQLVLTKFESQLTKLYRMGARNIIVSNIGPLGCLPSIKASQGIAENQCSSSVNSIVRNYNANLRLVIEQLNADLPGSKFIYANTFDTLLDISINPTKYGFQFGGVACCGLGKYKAESPCLPTFTPCPNRGDYVFWDNVHPSEKTNTILANQVYNDIMPAFLNKV